MDLIDPKTSDISGLLNTVKIKDDDNIDISEDFDFMKDDIVKDFNNNSQSENEEEENDDNNESEKYEEINPPKRNFTNEINQEDLKELFNDDNYDDLPELKQKLLKLDLLRRLADLAKNNGTPITTDYNMNSDYYSIKLEYNYHIGIRAKKRTVSNFYQGMICTTKGIEFLNSKFNPFGLNLNGWTMNLEASREELLDVLGELYDKYNVNQSKATTPEMQLIMILIKSMIMTIFTNTASSYVSSLFKNVMDDEEEKEKIRQKLKQTEDKPMEIKLTDEKIHKGEGIEDKFKEELANRNIQLKPPTLPASLQ